MGEWDEEASKGGDLSENIHCTLDVCQGVIIQVDDLEGRKDIAQGVRDVGQIIELQIQWCDIKKELSFFFSEDFI
jgi:hypothetical protein